MRALLFFYIFSNICAAQLYENTKNSPLSVLSVIKKDHYKAKKNIEDFSPYFEPVSAILRG